MKKRALAEPRREAVGAGMLDAGYWIGERGQKFLYRFLYHPPGQIVVSR